MAFGFNGFQVGKEIGAGLARPIDLTPTTDFIIQQGIQQKQLHQQMLEAVAKNVDAFNPKGVMRQDMPVVMDKYNAWRNLEMEHPEAVYDPKNPYFKKIDDARKDLYGTTAALVDGAKQVSDVSKMLAQSQLKDRYLSPEAATKWKSIMDEGYAAHMQKHPEDMDLIGTIIPNIHDSQQQITKSINDIIPEKTKDMSASNGEIVTSYTIPAKGYAGVMADADRMFKSFTPDQANYYQSLFLQMSPDELRNKAEELKNTYDEVPDRILGKGTRKSIEEFEIKTPKDLFVYDKLIQNPPISGSTKTDPEYINKINAEKTADVQQHRKITEAQASQRISQAATNSQNTELNSFNKQVNDAVSKSEAAYNRTAKSNKTQPMSDADRAQLFNSTKQAVIKERIKSGLWIPDVYRPSKKDKSSNPFSGFQGKDPFKAF